MKRWGPTKGVVEAETDCNKLKRVRVREIVKLSGH